VRTGVYRDRTDFLNQAVREYLHNHNIAIRPLDAPVITYFEPSPSVETVEVKKEHAKVPQEAIIADFAKWLESKFGILKEDALKNAFYEELIRRQAEICASFDIEPGYGHLPYATISKPILEGLKKTDLTKKAAFMLSDVENPESSRRRLKKA
jgi:hypothetical protein